jgi:N-acetylglucosaminyldiphosphoundecaprenol N-acetyl-beta-D-mannosaminyltransferase
MAELRPLLEAPVLLGVGAAFDFHAGRIKQAPRWMQNTGLEWLYRLSREPRRLWRRYLRNNPGFVIAIMRRRPHLVSAASNASTTSPVPETIDDVQGF